MKSKQVYYLLLCFPVLSQAYEGGEFALVGVGSSNCDLFVKQMESKTQAATAIYSQWQSGYISGLNAHSSGSKDFSHGIDRELLLEKTVKFCRDNTKMSFYEASRHVLHAFTQDSIFNKGSKPNGQKEVLNRDYWKD